MKRRGLSLGEALVSLSLILVVMMAVAAVCRDVSRMSRFAADNDQAVAVELRMLEMSRECAEGSEWLSPLGNAAAPEVCFRKIDPAREHEPPLPLDRLPAEPPLPPLPSWAHDDPVERVRVRYFYSATESWLMREQQPGQTVAVAPILPGFQARFLADRRLQLDYSYRNGSQQVSRRLLIWRPLPP
jgi:hypothetical protein